MAITRDIQVDWGVSGLAGTIAYRVVDPDGENLIERTTSGITEFPTGSGIYHAKIATWDPTWIGRVIWDAGGSGVGSFAGENFDEAAATADDVNVDVVVAPMTTQVLSPYFTTVGPTKRHLSIPQNAAATYTFEVQDGDEEPIALTGKTLKFNVFDPDGTILFSRQTGGSGITISGTDSNVASVAVTGANTATAGRYSYALWNTTDDTLYAEGDFIIRMCPQ